MCKTKMAINASDPSSAQTPRTRSRKSSQKSKAPPTESSRAPPSQTPPNQNPKSSGNLKSTTSSSGTNASSSNASLSIATSRTSLSSLRDSLPENTHIYDIVEIRAATNNFLAKRHSSSSSSTACWRCTLRGKEAIVFQRKFRRKIDMDELKQRLSVICRSHHVSVITLLGASVSGEHIYLVYEFIHGATLAECLRNPNNPSFTVLSTWISRMQIAADLADGLDYIHNKTGLKIRLVHNHIKSSSVMVTEPSFNGKICHFGTAQLCGDAEEEEESGRPEPEIVEEEPRELKRWGSAARRFEGVRGYMSPEFQATGMGTQKSDIYAFGVVILELLCGEEPLKYRFDKARRDFLRTSVIDTARAAIDGAGDEDGGGRVGRLRKWIDRRLRDSFPLEVAEKLIRVALNCVHVDPDKRPDMGRVAGKISKLYLESRTWSDNMKIPANISVSLAPR